MWDFLTLVNESSVNFGNQGNKDETVSLLSTLHQTFIWEQGFQGEKGQRHTQRGELPLRYCSIHLVVSDCRSNWCMGETQGLWVESHWFIDEALFN